MARAILEHKAREQGVKDLQFDSAGICARDGSTPDDLAVTALNELYGIDMGDHRSKSLARELMSWADLILAMETRIADQIVRDYPEAGSKTHAFAPYVVDTAGDTSDFKDGWAYSCYLDTARRISRLGDTLIAKLGE